MELKDFDWRTFVVSDVDSRASATTVGRPKVPRFASRLRHAGAECVGVAAGRPQALAVRCGVFVGVHIHTWRGRAGTETTEKKNG